MAYQGTQTTIKRMGPGKDGSRSATRYAATCLRNGRDPQINYRPVMEDDGTWTVVRFDKRRGQ